MLDEWFVLVVVVLLILSLVGGWGVYTAYADTDDEQTEYRTVEAWSTTGGFEHQSEVATENEVFEEGTVLTDRPTYFTEINPELAGEFTYVYSADDGDVDVEVELIRIVRAVDAGDTAGDGDGDSSPTVHWSVNETVETTAESGLEPNDEVTASFTVDVPEMLNESEHIEDSIGSSPGTVETMVVAVVQIDGTVEDDPVERTDRYELRLGSDGDAYRVDGPTAEERTEERTEPITVAGPSGPFGPIPAGILFIASFGLLGVLTLSKARGVLAPPASELERIRQSNERAEFDEWISTGTLPSSVRNRSQIAVSTLEDLVDVAVDCDRRVIEDGDTYYVVDGEVLYVYETPVREIAVEKTETETDFDESDVDAGDSGADIA